MAATRPLVLFYSDVEDLELEVTRARREAHIHRRENLHARSGQAFRLSQEREEKQLPIGTAPTVRQDTQKVEVEPDSFSRDQLLSLLRRALTLLVAARLGQCKDCSL